MSGRVSSLDARRAPAQLGFVCDGLDMPADESQMADVFSLWAERVRESDEACAAIAAARVEVVPVVELDNSAEAVEGRREMFDRLGWTNTRRPARRRRAPMRSRGCEHIDYPCCGC